MESDYLNNPALEAWSIRYPRGSRIFLEGDASQDLYILVSGKVEILKGDKIIAEIVETGAPFGEMSFLLQARRTATARSLTEVTAIRIPQASITGFLVDFPDASREITRRLALRLHETTRVLHGFKEFSDQLPDSVILTDRDGRILSWNYAAEELHGQTPEGMRHRMVEEIFQAPKEFGALLEELRSTGKVREKVLRIPDRKGGARFISTSSTILRDAHGTFQGVLYLSRDVSTVEKLRHRYRKTRSRLIPAVTVAVVLALALILGYPYFFQGYRAGDLRKQALRTQLARDFALLKTVLMPQFLGGEKTRLKPLIGEFMQVQGSGAPLYRGVVLLDTEKLALNACSIDPASNPDTVIGSSYSGVDFQGDDDSMHRVLVLYRTDKDHPMGRKEIEIAFQVFQESRLAGWLLFQIDADVLQQDYGLDETGLLAFRFPLP